MLTRTAIDSNWTFKQAGGDDDFLPVAQFPTNIHLDLMKHKKIPDPFVGKNENKVQWVDEETWIYQTKFQAEPPNSGERSVLAFDGLDTYATVVLNGKTILKTDNMFVPYRADVSSVLKGDNVLEITFDPTYKIGRQILLDSKHNFGCWNGDASRLAVRKAQYHYGWDWGPTMVTCGPWMPVHLDVYQARFEDVYFRVELDNSLKSAKLNLFAEIEGEADKVDFIVTAPDGSTLKASSKVSNSKAHTWLNVDNPHLWYPQGYGKQSLYTLTAMLSKSDASLDEQKKKIGFRKAIVVQRPLKDAPGTSFFFEVNNIPIFCGGSDWIPADHFLPRVSAQRYRDWLQLLVDGNQVMIRVWGGGIYEPDIFYDLCDEMGILTWQDFLFGCGSSPANPEFLKQVTEDSVAAVKRLRHHPSIVIYAGNNEDYDYARSEHLEYDQKDQNPQNWLKSTWPARYIYEKLLKEICEEYVPDVYYHFGSPYGGPQNNDPTIGDVHEWNVWHGAQHPYQEYGNLGGRFVSEFGMESFPHIDTVKSYIESPSDLYPQSSVNDFHNKAGGQERRLALYMYENFEYTFGMEEYIYGTQLMQAEALATAYRDWRRKWKGEGREYCSGALVWQLNDSWPVTSWAIVDYYLNPKLAYYAIKRALSHVSVAVQRTTKLTPKDKLTKTYNDSVTTISVWGSSFKLQNVHGVLFVRSFDLRTGKVIHEDKRNVDLLPNQSTELYEAKFGGNDEKQVVVQATFEVDGKVISRFVDWPQPFKHLALPAPKIEIKETNGGVTVSANVPVKGLELICKGARFDDNCLDLLPGDAQFVAVRNAGKMTYRYLGMK